jgi:glycosyltransferase involved in cell wall biosynthesis
MSGVDLEGLPVAFLAGTLGQGGAERQLFYILRALKSCGAAVRLLSLTQGEFWESRIQSLGIPVAWVGEKPSRMLRSLRVINELRRKPPRIVHSQHFYTNLYAVAAARALRSREIGAIRNDVWSEIRENGPILGRLSLRAPSTLAANSRAAIRNATECGVAASRLHFLPNVVDTDRFRPSRSIPCTQEIAILAAGRIVAQKRHDRLLRVMARVREQSNVPVRLLIAGDGPLRSSIEEQAAGMGLLPDSLAFLGAVADLAPVYQAADIFLLTSDHEGTPNVVLEAMACGLPVVATGVGGVPEILQDGIDGFLVPPSEEDLMVQRLLTLIEGKDRRIAFGDAARKRIEREYSPESLKTSLQQLYNAVLG